MTAEDRVKAVAEFGFTERQARFLVTSPFDRELRAFLQRNRDVLCALPGWTLRLLFLRRTGGVMSSLEDAAREELTRRSRRR